MDDQGTTSLNSNSLDLNNNDQKLNSCRLQDCILKNDVYEVERLISNEGVDPNIEYEGRLPLYIACEFKSFSVVQLLLEKYKVKLNTKNFFEETSLHVAIKSGDIDIVKLLVEHGARINRGDGDKIRPIHLATSIGRKDIATFLLNNGAKLNVKDRNGYTPLHCILLNDHDDLTSYMIQCGSDVNIQDQLGNTPLMIAAVRGLGIDIIDQLLVAGADPNIVNGKGRSPLFATIYHDHDVNVAIRILDAGSNFMYIDIYNENYTLLHYACVHGQLEIVKRLIKLGVDIDIPSISNETPLYVSVKRGFTTLVKYLISEGCDVNIMTENAYDNYSPLHAAICYYSSLSEFMEVTDLLVYAGACLDMQLTYEDREFRPFVLLAMMCQKFNFAAYLIAIGCPIENNTFVLGSALHRAFSIRQSGLMRQMYDAGINLDNEQWINAYLYGTTLHEFFGLEELLCEFMAETSTPRSLKNICRINIRNFILSKNLGPLKRCINKLDISWGHKFFLMMEFNPLDKQFVKS